MTTKTFKVVLVLFLTTVSLFSCSKLRQNTSQEPVETTDSINEADEYSDIELDTLVLPVEEVPEISIILQAGYRGTQPSDYAVMRTENWFDFYQNPTSQEYFMEKATIVVDKFYDDCLEDSTTSVSSERNSILMIKGLAPKNKFIQSIHVEKKMIWPDEKYSVEFNGKQYTLRGTGIVLESGQALSDESEDGQRWDEVANYKMYLSETGMNNEQLLIAIPRFNGTFVELVWVGDLDEDGKPDFVFDVSPDYEYKRVVLFLSSKAGNGEFVKCAGISEYGFDC